MKYVLIKYAHKNLKVESWKLTERLSNLKIKISMIYWIKQ